RAADKGVLFLDEIGELGLDEQAMLLRAIEAKRFLPLGADVEVHSDFQLIAGTNVDLRQAVSSGHFRGDLLARIDLWHFDLPGLADRRQDIEPNLNFELQKFAQALGRQVAFNKSAKARFLRFALDPSSPWTGNFRDLNAAVLRMATLAPGGRIGEDQVNAEIARLQRRWGGSTPTDPVAQVLGETPIDRFDRAQLNEVITVCRSHATAAAAGRALFAHSRTQRATQNDGDRLRKYLAKWGLDFGSLQG
ncbi:MAG: transcriptional regulatory protein RtcR, partial [Cognaticolwellia sp.]